LKQNYLRSQREAEGRQITLIDDIPETRATQDLDLILNVGLWIEITKAQSLCDVLQSRLGYETVLHNWQFRKPLPAAQDRYVKLDIQSRSPTAEERKLVKVRGNPKQVGRDMKTGIAGRETPEAFAVDALPIALPVSFEGGHAAVFVPHPYAWLNMKVRAAYDWFLEQRGEVRPKLTPNGDRIRLKHVYDVYVVTAMMTEKELTEASTLAELYQDHDEARKTREQARELYGKADAIGIQAIRAYASQSFRTSIDLDYDVFWEGLQTALNIGE
jgi:hypothetical protein